MIFILGGPCRPYVFDSGSNIHHHPGVGALGLLVGAGTGVGVGVDAFTMVIPNARIIRSFIFCK